VFRRLENMVIQLGFWQNAPPTFHSGCRRIRGKELGLLVCLRQHVALVLLYRHGEITSGMANFPFKPSPAGGGGNSTCFVNRTTGYGGGL
jgi:hypothetical protein